MPYWFLIKKKRNKNAIRQITKPFSYVIHTWLSPCKKVQEFGQKIKWVLSKVLHLQGKESSVETFVGWPIETPALVSLTLSHSYHYFHNFAKYIRKRAYRELFGDRNRNLFSLSTWMSDSNLVQHHTQNVKEKSENQLSLSPAHYSTNKKNSMIHISTFYEHCAYKFHVENIMQ